MKTVIAITKCDEANNFAYQSVSSVEETRLICSQTRWPGSSCSMQYRQCVKCDNKIKIKILFHTVTQESVSENTGCESWVNEYDVRVPTARIKCRMSIYIRHVY